MTNRTTTRCAVEAIGTFFLVLAAVWGGAFAAGFMLLAMVFAGGHISGGHYNPAVSLALWIRRALTTADLLPYVASQCAGAVGAGLVGGWLRGPDAHVGLHAFHGDAVGHAFVVELLVTFALAWTVLNVATVRAHSDNSFYGLAIGAIVLAGGTAFGDLSGGAFNPAVGLGLPVAHAVAWANLWVYVVACSLGGVLAGVTFRAVPCRCCHPPPAPPALPPRGRGPPAGAGPYTAGRGHPPSWASPEFGRGRSEFE